MIGAMVRARSLVVLLGAGVHGCAREPFRCTTPLPQGEPLARLNEPLRLDFSATVDPASVAAGSVRALRRGDGAELPGRWRCDGVTLTFVPAAPTRVDLADAAFAPGSDVQVEVVGLPRMVALRALTGEALASGFTLRRPVAARSGDWRLAPTAELFCDPRPGPPELVTRTARFAAGRIELCFSEPLDPRTLAAARFRLHGPWSRESHPADNPDMAATLVANGEAAVVALELRPGSALPMPVDAATPLELRFEPKDALRDLGGAALAQNGGPFYPYIPVAVGDD